MVIQIVLISGVVGAVFFALRGGTASLTGTRLAAARLGGLVFMLAAVVAIAFPESTVWLANKMNVKRGTDLLLYAFFVTFLYVVVALYQRIHRLEQRIIDLTRAVALGKGGDTTPEPSVEAKG